MQVADFQGDALYRYTQNQVRKDVNFARTNDLPLPVQAQKYQSFNSPQNRDVVGCTNSYPLGSLIKNKNQLIDQSYVQYMNENPNGNAEVSGFVDSGSVGYPPNKPIFGMNNASIPKGSQTNIVEGFSANGGENNATEINPMIPTNDPTSEMLLDLKSRPMTDFVHNNMLPFYGSSVKQNMAGTGVSSGNYIDGVNVNSGFDETTPYIDKLNAFTGLDDTYLHKREVGPQFSPAEQQTNWVYGTPLFREDEEVYKRTLYKRNDLAPCEKELVGPGLDLDSSIPAAGGFHEFTRVMPNNVEDYKANQLENRVIAQQFQLGGKEPTAYPGPGTSQLGSSSGPGVAKNRPDTFYSQARRPTMTTKVGYSDTAGEEIRPDYRVDFKPNNASREQISYGYGNIVYKNSQVPKSQLEQFKNEFNAVDIMDDTWK
jgi:hypothetical protein